MSRAPNEQQAGALQEERRTTLEQVKDPETIIVSGEIRADEANQLQKLYMIKLKYYICMLETNVNNISEVDSYHIDLKTETKGDDIRK